MKKFLVIILLFSLVFTFFPVNRISAASISFSGDGTEGNPYLIENHLQFQDMVRNSPDNTHYKLIKDIYFPDNFSYTSMRGTAFKAYLDGNGHSVNNITYNCESGIRWCSIVPSHNVNSGIGFKNIKFNDIKIIGNTDTQTIGVFKGLHLSTIPMTLQNVTVTNLLVDNSASTVTNVVSGLIGVSTAATGRFRTYSDRPITNVNLTDAVLKTSSTTVAIYGFGAISPTYSQPSSVNNIYTSFSVQSPTDQSSITYGISSNSNDPLAVTNAYYDITKLPSFASGEGDGLTSSQLQQKSNFIGFDFDNVWTMNASNNGMPILKIFDNSLQNLATIIGGSLYSSYDPINFNSVTLNFSESNPTANAVFNAKITDNRGSGAGWNFSVSATDFVLTGIDDPSISTSGTIDVKFPVSALSLNISNPTLNVGQAIDGLNGPIKSSSTLNVSSSAQTIIQSQKGYGMGIYDIPLEFIISLPKTAEVTNISDVGSKYNVGDFVGTFAGTYSTTITFTTTSGV